MARDIQRRTLYSVRAGERNAECRGELRSANSAIAADPGTAGHRTRDSVCAIASLAIPKDAVRDLTPILDELRAVKSPREIALIRRLAACRSGPHRGHEEHPAGRLRIPARRLGPLCLPRGRGKSRRLSLDHRLGHGQHLEHALLPEHAQLKDGDLVLMDFAPEYRYYTSDIARIWPVNGKYSAPQRELLQFVLDYRNAVMARIRPGVTPRTIRDEAKAAMVDVFRRDAVLEADLRAAAHRLVDTGGGVFSHPVGMAVHDDGSYSRVS